ncbi:MAG: LytTR family DNA-binding domain-containing protein, partial [Planktomarina sp.]
VLIGIGIVLAVAGAFGTSDVLHPFPLTIYWVGIVCVTYAVGNFLNLLCLNLWGHWNRWLRIGASGLGIGTAVFVIVVGLNIAVFGQIYNNASDLARIAVTVIVVTSVVNLILNIVFEAVAQPKAEGTKQPTLLDRLPFDKRGPILHLAAEDHYTKVTTPAGQTLLLIRFADAVAEAAPTPGLQTHRSHWISLQAITDVERHGDGAKITILGGEQVPVSRGKIAAVRKLGLL